MEKLTEEHILQATRSLHKNIAIIDVELKAFDEKNDAEDTIYRHLKNKRQKLLDMYHFLQENKNFLIVLSEKQAR